MIRSDTWQLVARGERHVVEIALRSIVIVTYTKKMYSTGRSFNHVESWQDSILAARPTTTRCPSLNQQSNCGPTSLPSQKASTSRAIPTGASHMP